MDTPPINAIAYLSGGPRTGQHEPFWADGAPPEVYTSSEEGLYRLSRTTFEQEGRTTFHCIYNWEPAWVALYRAEALRRAKRHGATVLVEDQDGPLLSVSK